MKNCAFGWDVLVESNNLCLFVLLEVGGFCVKCLSLLWLGVRTLERRRRGIVGKIGGGVCAGKLACGKRIIV